MSTTTSTMRLMARPGQPSAAFVKLMIASDDS
jgi:hypothetical protein